MCDFAAQEQERYRKIAEELTGKLVRRDPKSTFIPVRVDIHDPSETLFANFLARLRGIRSASQSQGGLRQR